MPAPTIDPGVRPAFDRVPAAARRRLLELRGLILATASDTDGVGRLVETLKWGEPAYLPRRPRIGTTIRINAHRRSWTQVAMCVHCQTTLVADFRARYPDTLRFEGNRAILLDVDTPLPVRELRHCIALALTYHLRARTAA